MRPPEARTRVHVQNGPRPGACIHKFVRRYARGNDCSTDGPSQGRQTGASFMVGDRVIGKYRDDLWYPATISKQQGPRFVLDWDDADTEDRVKTNLELRFLEDEPEDSECRSEWEYWNEKGPRKTRCTRLQHTFPKDYKSAVALDTAARQGCKASRTRLLAFLRQAKLWLVRPTKGKPSLTSNPGSSGIEIVDGSNPCHASESSLLDVESAAPSSRKRQHTLSTPSTANIKCEKQPRATQAAEVGSAIPQDRRTRLPSKSRYLGVQRTNLRGKSERWRAAFRGQYLGTFANEKDAALAFDAAARTHPGATLNFRKQLTSQAEAEAKRTTWDPKTMTPVRGSSRFRGVHWQCRRKTWMARYSMHATGKHFNLGSYNEEEHAALAWDAEARRQGRGTAQLNFPEQHPSPEQIDSWRIMKYKFFKSTSKFRGVSLDHKGTSGFVVQINIVRVQDALGRPRGHPIRLGPYASEIAAAKAYDATCRRCGIPERDLNFPYRKQENFRRCVDPRQVQRRHPTTLERQQRRDRGLGL